jgi:hypothetical protein
MYGIIPKYNQQNSEQKRTQGRKNLFLEYSSVHPPKHELVNVEIPDCRHPLPSLPTTVSGQSPNDEARGITGYLNVDGYSNRIAELVEYKLTPSCPEEHRVERTCF